MLKDNLLKIAEMLTKEQKYSLAHDIESAVECIAEQQEKIKILREGIKKRDEGAQS
jgi:hypothetical protein